MPVEDRLTAWLGGVELRIEDTHEAKGKVELGLVSALHKRPASSFDIGHWEDGSAVAGANVLVK